MLLTFPGTAVVVYLVSFRTREIVLDPLHTVSSRGPFSVRCLARRQYRGTKVALKWDPRTIPGQ